MPLLFRLSIHQELGRFKLNFDVQSKTALYLSFVLVTFMKICMIVDEAFSYRTFKTKIGSLEPMGWETNSIDSILSRKPKD